MNRIGERVELFRGRDRLWYFHRVAANHEVVADSEGYQNRADAVATAARLFPAEPLWINDEGEWRLMSVPEDQIPEATDVIPDEELLDPQPEPEEEPPAPEDPPVDDGGDE